MRSSQNTPRSRSRFTPFFVRRLSSWLVLSTALTVIVGEALTYDASGNAYSWDADGNAIGNNAGTGAGLGGSGVWDTSSSLWWDGVNPLTPWPNVMIAPVDTAVFMGVGGLVQVGAPITVGTLTFNLAGFHLTGDGTAGTRKLTLADSAAVQVNVAGVATINAVIAGSSGLNLSSTTTGTLVLTGANSFTGDVNIDSGTLNISSDANLGDAANDLTFSGAVGTLSLTGPVVLGAGRQINLNNSGAVTLTPTTTGQQVILGQVTGSGALNLVNSGVTHLLSSTNDFTGVLWVQNGVLSINSIGDALGSGNIKLGSGTGTSSTFQWGTGAGSALVLSNRAFELAAGTTGGGTIDSSASAAARAITINTNLAFTVPDGGNKTLTLTGINTGTNTFAGDITDNGSSTTAVTKTGTTLWVLSGAGNSFTGNLTVSQGVLRATHVNALGGDTGNLSFAGNGVLEIRVDSPELITSRPVTINQNQTTFIYVDHAIGSTAVNGTVTLGPMSPGGNNNFNVLGDHGYGLTLGVHTFNHSTTNGSSTTLTTNNYLSAPGFGAAGYTAGILTIGGFATDNVANPGGILQVLSGWGDYAVTGAVSSAATLPININKNGTGVLTWSPDVSGWVTGLFTLSGGTTRFTAVPTGGATLSLGTSLVELRNDVSTDFAIQISNTTSGNSTLVVDHTIGGVAAGNTATLTSITYTNNSAVLNVVGDHGYGLNTGAVTINANVGGTFGNYLDARGYAAAGYTPGAFTIGSLTNASGGTGTLMLAGFGNYTDFNGNVSNTGGGNLHITKNGIGAVGFSGDNSAWTSGNLTLSTGLTRATGVQSLGSAVIVFPGAALLELRADAGSNVFGNNILSSSSPTIMVDHSVGGTNTGGTVTMGTLATNANNATINVVGAHGYHFTTGAVIINGTRSLALGNYLGAPGYGAAGYAAGLLTLGSVTTDAAAGTSTLTLSGFGDYAFGGALSSSNAATALSVTKNGIGIATFSGDNSGWTSTTQGVLFTSAGTTTIDATNLSALGSANLGLSGGLLEFRTNSGTSGAMWTGKNLTFTSAASIAVDPLVGSSDTGKTVELGALLANANQELRFTGNHSYGLTFNAAATSNQNSTVTLNNVGNGTVTFAGGLASVTTAAQQTMWSFQGNGDFHISGNVVDTTGRAAMTKNGQGTLTLSGSGSSFTGALQLNNGVIRVTNAGALGGGTGTINLQANTGSASGFDLRNDAGMDLSQHNLGTALNSIINVDRTGASATNQTMILGGGTVFVNSNWGMAITGAHGYSLQFGSAGNTTAFTVANNVGIQTMTNFIPNVGGSGSVIFHSGITFLNVANASGINLAGTGDYLLSGKLTSGTTTNSTVTKSGAGTLTITSDNSTTFNTALSIFTMTGGVTRVTTGNGLGGALATVNLNGAALDLRSDTAFTVLPTILVGTTNSFINVDRAIGGAGTGQTMALGGLRIGTFTLYLTGGNDYGLNLGSLNVTGAGTIINNIGGAGVVTISGISSVAVQTLTLGGSGEIDVTGGIALNASSGLIKTGSGLLKLTGASTYTGPTNVRGGTIQLAAGAGGSLNGATGTALTVSDTGIFELDNTGAAGSVSQGMGAFSASVGDATIQSTRVVAQDVTLALDALARTAGATANFVISGGTNGTENRITATGTTAGAFISQGTFFNGADYAVADTAGGYLRAMTTGDTNYVADTTLTAGRFNYLTAQVDAQAAIVINTVTLSAAGVGIQMAADASLTLTNGGILKTGGGASIIDAESGTSAIVTASSNGELVIRTDTSGDLLTIAIPLAPNGTGAVTKSGAGTLVLSAASAYPGKTFINAGTLALGIDDALPNGTGKGALQINLGGTFDLAGFNAGLQGISGWGAIENSTASAVTMTIGEANGTGVFNGTVQNSGGGALSVVKTGTGAITLGDSTGGSNQFTGDLSINDTGVLSINSLADSVGTRINLGATGAATATGLTFIGSSDLTLNNRAFDLVGDAGQVATITASGVQGAGGVPGMLIIGRDLTPSASGDKTLIFAGNTGVANSNIINFFNGNISNPTGGGTTALTFSGTGIWGLTGTNTFTGGITLSGTGTLRGTNASSFGGSANTINVTASGLLDLRSDGSVNFANPITMNQNFTINVDRSVGGSGYGQVMTIGDLTEATTTGRTLTITNITGTGNSLGASNPINGYGLRIPNLFLTFGTSTFISNALGSPGEATFAVPTVGTGVAGALVIDNINLADGLTHDLTIQPGLSTTAGTTIISGDITQGAGAVLGLTYTGNSFLTLAGTAATNYSGGLTINSSGTVRATTAYSLGAGAINLSRGNLEVRNDASVNYGNAFNWNANNSVALYVGEALLGTSGHHNTFTFGTLTITAASARSLTVAGIGGSNNNSANSVTFGGVVIGDNFNNAITNTLLLPGTLNLGNISNANADTASTQILTINGAGVTTAGDISDGTGTSLTGILYTGNGILDLSRATAGSTFTGGLTINNGSATVRLANVAGVATEYGLGASTNAINFATGIMEFRSDVDVTYSNPINWTANADVRIYVGQLPGGTGHGGGEGTTFTLGTFNISALPSAKTLIVAGIGGSGANNGNSVTLGGVVIGGTFTNTINNSLPLPGFLNIGNITNINAAGTQILTLAGAGVTTVGDISNGTGTSLTAITYTGTGILDLGRATAANTFTGGLTLSGGTTRVTNQYGLGAASNNVIFNSGGAILELRSDTDVTYGNQFQNLNGGVINIGQLPGGTGIHGATGVTFTLGLLKIAQTARNVSINGIGGSQASSTGNLTFSAVDLNGFALTTLTNGLQIPSQVNVGPVSTSVAGSSVLAIAGIGVTTVGDVDDGSGTVGLTYTGTGFLDLSRATSANTYTGGFIQANTGTVRVTSAWGFGAGSINLQNGTTEVRSDTDLNFTNVFNWNGGGANITVGQLPGGTGNNGAIERTITFGALTAATTSTGRTLTISGIGNTLASSGYSVVIGGVTFGNGSNNFSNIVTNNLTLPGTLSLGDITGAGTSGTITFGLNGIGFTTIGNVTNGSGGSITALTHSGPGIVQVTGTGTANFSGGINVTGGTLRMIGANSFGSASSTINLVNGTLDVRGDSDFGVNNQLNLIPAANQAVTINLDQATSGNPGRTITFNGAATILGNATTSRTLTLNSGSNTGAIFTNGLSIALTGWTITNNASGPIDLGPINYTVAAGTLAINGSGTTVLGNITGTTAPLAIAYSGTGLLDLTGNNGGANPMSGLTLTGGGITRVSTAPNLGAAGATLTFTGTATLQVRNDNGGTSNGTINFGAPISLTVGTSGYLIDLANNGGSATGNTVAFGSLNNGNGANGITLTINGAHGYGASFTTLTLPSGIGATTVIAANAPVTISGNVTNAMSGFSSSHFDTLTLDGIVGGTVNGNISDATGGSVAAGGTTRITKQGAGTWTLTGTNTFTGLINVSAGTLIASADAINAANAGSGLTIGSTGTFRAASSITTAKTITVSTGAQIDTNGNEVTISGRVTGSGFTKTGSGTLVMTNVTNTQDNLTIANGVVSIPSIANQNVDQPLGQVNGRVFLGSAGTTGTLQYTGGTTASSQPFAVAADGTGVIQVDGGAAVALTISGAISSVTQGSGTFTKTGTGTLILAGSNSFSGGTINLNDGILQAGNSTALGAVALSNRVVFANGSGAILNIAVSTTAAGVTGDETATIQNGVGGNTVLTLNGVSDSVFSGQINNGALGTLGLALAGSGTLTLDGSTAHTFSNGVAINAGLLVLDAANVAGNENLVDASNTLTFGGGGLSVMDGTQTFASLITTANSGSSTITIGVNSTLTITSGTQSFSSGSSLNLNTAAGGADASGSTVGTALMIWNTGTAGAILNSSFTVTDLGGTGFATKDGADQIIRLVAGTLLPGSGADSSTNYLVDNNLTDNGNGPGVEAGGHALVITAAQSTNSITVDTTARSGVLTLDNDIVLTNTNYVFGATSGSNTYAITGGTGAGGLRGNGTNAGLALNNTNGGTVTISARILANGSGGLIVNGTGTTILSGANAYTGATVLNDTGTTQFTGTMGASAININDAAVAQLDVADGLTAANSITFGASGSGQFNLNSAGVAVGTVTFGAGSAGQFTLNGYDLTVNALVTNATIGTPIVQNASATDATLSLVGTLGSYGSVIQDGIGGGTLSLIVDGTGTQTLSGANTYTGGTTVNGGTLSVTGSLSASSVVNVTSSTGGTLSLGNSLGAGVTGTITFSGTNTGLAYRTDATVANPLAMASAGTVVNMLGTSNTTIFTGAVTGDSTTSIRMLAGTFNAATIFQSDFSGFSGTLAYDTPVGTNQRRLTFSGANGATTANTAFELSGVVVETATTASSSLITLSTSNPTGFQMGALSGTGGIININTANGGLVVGNLDTDTIYSGVLRGTAPGTAKLTKVGAGSLTLSGDNTYTGTTTVSAGTLLAGADVALMTISNATVTANPTLDTLTLAAHPLVAGDKVAFTGGTTPTGTLFGVTYFVVNATVDTFQLSTTEGGDAIDLTAAGTTPALSRVGAFGSASSDIVLGDATTAAENLSASLLTAGAFTVERAVTVANLAGGSYSIGGNTDNSSTFSGLITINQALTVQQVATTGGHALNLTGGMVSGNGPQIVIFANVGAVNMSTTAITDDNFSFVQTGAGTTTFSAANTSTGLLTVSSGEVDLNTTGAPAWSGNAGISGGILKLLQNDQIADDRTLTFSGGVFELNGRSETVAGVTLTGGTILDTATGGSLTSTTDFVLRSGTASGVLAGNVGATKTTTGTVFLNAANTYTGTTVVSAGELVVGGSLAGSVNVEAGGTLSGGANLTAQVAAITASSSALSGATIAPGQTGGPNLQTIGTLTADGDVTLGTAEVGFVAAQLHIEIGGAGDAANAGTTYDRLHVAGAPQRLVTLENVDLVGSLVDGFSPVIDATSSGGQFLTDGSKYFVLTLANDLSTRTGFFANQGAADGNLTAFNTITVGGQLFAISYTANFSDFNNATNFTGGNDVALMAIPEPNSLAMLAASFGLALGLQRFRRRSC